MNAVCFFTFHFLLEAERAFFLFVAWSPLLWSRAERSNESCSPLTIQAIRIYNPFYSNVANTFLATKACKEWSGFSIICLLLRRGFRTFAVPQSQTLSMLSAFVAFSTVSNIHAGPAAAARVRFLMPGGLDGYRHFMLLLSQFSR